MEQNNIAAVEKEGGTEMGIYDTVMSICPACGAVNRIQTKVLSTCQQRTLEVGSTVIFRDGVLRLKEDCDRCGEPICVRVERFAITEILNSTTPDYEESASGVYSIVSDLQALKDEQTENINRQIDTIFERIKQKATTYLSWGYPAAPDSTLFMDDIEDLVCQYYDLVGGQ